MPLPPGLHFNPFDAAKAVDPTTVKKYDMPHQGQTFVQLHNGGAHVIVGTVVGFDFRLDRQGNLVEWRAAIDCKLTNSFTFANGQTWRDASEWHPAPVEQQEGADDLRGALAAVVERLEVLEADAGYSDLGTELTKIRTCVDGVVARLDVLEPAVAPKPGALIPSAQEMRVSLDARTPAPVEVVPPRTIVVDAPPTAAESAALAVEAAYTPLVPSRQESQAALIAGHPAPLATAPAKLPRFGRK